MYSDIFIKNLNFIILVFFFFLEKNGSTPPPVRGCMLTESRLPNRVMKWEKGLSYFF